MPTPSNSVAPSPAVLTRIWAGIGLQSFGGGASTQLLIRRQFVETRDWIEPEEFNRFWNLCQFTPGINLIALTILIGHKLAGWRGIIAALAGLLVPSATITCALAAGFATVQHNGAVHAVLRGIVPATAGVMAVVALSFSQPVLQYCRREGVRALVLSAVLVAGGAFLLIVIKLSAIPVLALMAICGALLLTPSDRQAGASSATPAAQKLPRR